MEKWAAPGAQPVKNPPAMQETPVRSLSWKDPLEEGMATHISILAWRIPWTEEPGQLQSMGRKESDMTKYRAAQWGNRGGKRMKQEIVFTSLWECSVEDTKTFLRNLNIRNSPTPPPQLSAFPIQPFLLYVLKKELTFSH